MATQATTQDFKRGMSWGERGFFAVIFNIEQSKDDIVEIIQNLIDFAL